ncbi:carbon monoxide dehydrogenase subunit G [Parafrankia sp. EAN1pec]|uniref:SRPBCC family protein n=1 Tax=Parafrankia sp. (strain EAN1pec) TaxID=298653 RepID=UPI00015D9D86|nr:carbon monoxide dehydrogenase subunit G [Frankia sp. EAN1pec]
MDLSNEFRVDASPATTWSVLTDLERIAPCLPGAQLQEVEGEEYRGIVKVKVGPVSAQYKGTAVFLERDESAHRAVLKADGRETRGQGNASATITVTLTPDGAGTQVNVLTDLRITGKVAQFGRGVISDVSTNLLGRFAESLESTVLRGDTAPTTAPVAVTVSEPATPAPAAPVVPGPGLPSVPAEAASATRVIHQPEPEPVNLLDTAGAPVVKRLAPVLVAFLMGWLLSSLFRRGRG